MEEQSAPQFSQLEPPLPQLGLTNVLNRYYKVFVSPNEAYEGIVEIKNKKMLWLVPLTISIIVSILLAALMTSNPNVLQEEHMSVTLFKTVIYFAAIFGTPLSWLLMTLLYWIVFRIIMGCELSFGDIFTVYALGTSIPLINAILNSSLLMITGSIHALLDLGFLVSAESNAALHVLLSQLNPFTFWMLWVLGIGFAKMSGLPLKKAMTGVAGLWVVMSTVWVLSIYALHSLLTAFYSLKS